MYVAQNAVATNTSHFSEADQCPRCIFPHNSEAKLQCSYCPLVLLEVKKDNAKDISQRDGVSGVGAFICSMDTL